MATYTKFSCFAEDVAEGKHNLASDTLMIAMTNTAPSITNTVLANIVEISYTNISSRVLTVTSSSQSSGLYKLVVADLLLTASGAVGPYRYLVIYNNTSATKPLIGFYDLGTNDSLLSGQTAMLDFNQTNGVLIIQ